MSDSHDNNQTPPRRSPRVGVEIGGEQITLAEYYHRASSYQPRAHLPGMPWRTCPSVYKTYRRRPTTALREVRPSDGGTVLDATARWRSAPPRLAPSTMTFDDLSAILFHGQGITDVLKFGTMTYDLRAAPSAGALYPVDVYAVVSRVERLAPGLYHHAIKEHSLVLLKEGDFSKELEKAAGCPHLYEPAAATLLLSVMFARSGVKYRERVYRYVNMDAGHVAYNLGVSAAARGLGAPLVARFDDGAINALLEIDTEKEAALLLMPLGKTAPDAKQTADLPEPPFAAVRPKPPESSARYVRMIHEGTSQRVGRGEGTLAAHSAHAGGADRAGTAREAATTPADDPIALPDPAGGDALFPVIGRRRSTRDYSSAAMTQEELSALCVAAAGDGADEDPFHAVTAPLNLYAAVRHVEGIEPGVYLFDPLARSLRLIRSGDFSAQCKRANLNQDFCRTAHVVFFKTVTFDALGRPDGDRGYRYANIRSGIMGGALYLQATALGLGVCGVGAFMDDDVAAILGSDPLTEPVLYVTAVGK